MSTQDDRIEGAPLCHDMSLAYETFFMLKDMRETEHKYLTGKLLTFIESLFDEGARCEAVKSTLKTILYEFRTDAEKNTRSLAYELAGAIGDLTMQEDLNRAWGAQPWRRALPRLVPSELTPSHAQVLEPVTDGKAGKE